MSKRASLFALLTQTRSGERAFDAYGAWEATARFIAAGLIALVRENRDRDKFRLEQLLIGADRLADVVEVLSELLTGPSAHSLAEESKALVAELSSRPTWTTECAAAVTSGLGKGQPFAHPVKIIDLFQAVGLAELDGVTPEIEDQLFEALARVVTSVSVLSLEWAHIHKKQDGQYRISGFANEGSGFLQYFRSNRDVELPNGVYILLERSPVFVSLVRSDDDARKIFVVDHLEGSALVFRSAGQKQPVRHDGTKYLKRAEELTPSETDGLGRLETIGAAFTNLPPLPPDNVRRDGVEATLLTELHRDNQTMVSLSGQGGTGKTSVALQVIHDMLNGDDNPFQMVIWFSARDVDLRAEGPVPVRPQGLTQRDFASYYAELLGETPSDVEALLSRDMRSNVIGRTLFVFDNFETVTDADAMLAWIYGQVAPPNKVLITTRIRGERSADLPIKVFGMERGEALQLVSEVVSRLKISSVVTSEFRDKIIADSAGHPYMMKILLGDVSREGKLVSVDRLVSSHQDILTALFDRSYNSMTPETKRVFLTLCSWKGAMSEFVLEAVMNRPTDSNIEVIDRIDELLRSSFIESRLSEKDGTQFLDVPLTAWLFDKRRIMTSESRSAIQADSEILQLFSSSRKVDPAIGTSKMVSQFRRAVFDHVRSDPKSLGRMVAVLVHLASRHPLCWITVANLHDEFGSGRLAATQALDALKRFVETDSLFDRPDAWWRMGKAAKLLGDRSAEIAYLAAMCEEKEVAARQVAYAAMRMNLILKDHPRTFEDAERRILIGRILSRVTPLRDDFEAPDCSHVAHLYVHQGEQDEAEAMATHGIHLDPSDEHCRRLLKNISERKQGGRWKLKPR